MTYTEHFLKSYKNWIENWTFNFKAQQTIKISTLLQNYPHIDHFGHLLYTNNNLYLSYQNTVQMVPRKKNKKTPEPILFNTIASPQPSIRLICKFQGSHFGHSIQLYPCPSRSFVLSTTLKIARSFRNQWKLCRVSHSSSNQPIQRLVVDIVSISTTRCDGLKL